VDESVIDLLLRLDTALDHFSTSPERVSPSMKCSLKSNGGSKDPKHRMWGNGC
jgi:hypothetical protein